MKLVNAGMGEWVNGARRRARRADIHQPANSPIRQFSEAGFTLIELMVVISLIIVLASMGLVQYRQSIVRSKEAVLKEDLFRMRDAIDQYYADKNSYPSAIDSLVSDGYLRSIPKDPFTNSESSWQTIPAEPDPNNPVGDPGIYDVKSGADATALDGSRYSDW
jgi:general secretion pathway protein G